MGSKLVYIQGIVGVIADVWHDSSAEFDVKSQRRPHLRLIELPDEDKDKPILELVQKYPYKRAEPEQAKGANMVNRPTVELLYWTGKESADPLFPARLLAFTKNTRLTDDGKDAWERYMTMEDEKLIYEVSFMASTVPSSWEFMDFVFVIRNASRALQQQITRTRNASYAIQAMRVVDMTRTPTHVNEETLPTGSAARKRYEEAVAAAMLAYADLTGMGVPREDAREVLGLGTGSNIVAKYNLRALTELLWKRSSKRVQPEYRAVVEQMEALCLASMPWLVAFFEHPNEKAIRMLDELAERLKGPGNDGLGNDEWIAVAKAADQLRKVD